MLTKEQLLGGIILQGGREHHIVSGNGDHIGFTWLDVDGGIRVSSGFTVTIVNTRINDGDWEFIHPIFKENYPIY